VRHPPIDVTRKFAKIIACLVAAGAPGAPALPAADGPSAELRVPAFTKYGEPFTRPATGKPPSDIVLPEIPLR